MLKDKVSKEIDRLVDEKLLIPVETSEWVTSIVLVVKANGTIRLCGDYKMMLNKFLEVDRYPIPRINDLMNEYFTRGVKILYVRLCQTYQQLPLDLESRKLTTIFTHKGLFMFKCMPYEVSSALGILQ